MNNASAILRSLAVYAVCVPLALIIGYLLANQWDYSTFALGGIFVGLLALPILLRWHYPLLLLSWNTGIVIPFFKGSPSLCLVMIAISFGLAILHRAVNPQQRFINVPQITAPLLVLIAVILVTAKLTGGFGLRAFGSEVMGGKKYVWLVVYILGFFALTAQVIPKERAYLFVGLYILGAMAQMVGDFLPVIPSSLYFIFWFFPPSMNGFMGDFELGVTRLVGTGAAGFAITSWLLARHGLRGIFVTVNLWRPALFFLGSLMIFLGGFRSAILTLLGYCLLLFFVEGLHRTRALYVGILACLLGAALVVPLADKLPFTFQRALAFLPLQLKADAVLSAQDSSDWRIRMWQSLLPEIPKYFWLGKGYVISQQDFQMMDRDTAFKAFDAGEQGLALAGDYHNGGLSVIIPFGIWGVIAFLWLMAAGFWVAYRNYRYGDPNLRTLNNFLWISYIYLCFRFFVVFGSFSSDMLYFSGLLGLSIALNGGVCRPAPVEKFKTSPALERITPLPRRRFQPALPRVNG